MFIQETNWVIKENGKLPSLSQPRYQELIVTLFSSVVCDPIGDSKKPIAAGIFQYLSGSSDIFRHLHVPAVIFG